MLVGHPGYHGCSPTRWAASQTQQLQTYLVFIKVIRQTTNKDLMGWIGDHCWHHTCNNWKKNKLHLPSILKLWTIIIMAWPYFTFFFHIWLPVSISYSKFLRSKDRKEWWNTHRHIFGIASSRLRYQTLQVSLVFAHLTTKKYETAILKQICLISCITRNTKLLKQSSKAIPQYAACAPWASYLGSVSYLAWWGSDALTCLALADNHEVVLFLNSDP